MRPLRLSLGMRAPRLRPGSKFGNRKWLYNGRQYHSRLEANFAARLDLLRKAGEVGEFWPQVKVPIKINGQKVCSYTVDFLVWFTDGREVWYEVKGMPTPVGNLKIKLFRACYPQRVLEVISND